MQSHREEQPQPSLDKRLTPTDLTTSQVAAIAPFPIFLSTLWPGIRMC
jgi:hypothetical protein